LGKRRSGKGPVGETYAYPYLKHKILLHVFVTHVNTPSSSVLKHEYVFACFSNTILIRIGYGENEINKVGGH